jgi:general secretion pathway protein D
MTTTSSKLALCCGLAVLTTGAFAQQPAAAPAPGRTPPAPGTAAAPATPATPRAAPGNPGVQIPGRSASGGTTGAITATTTPTNGGLRFNFRNAPLETVLNYMSEAAGFVIIMESPVRGNIDMWSAQPVTKEEAVQLLNLALNKHGYTASAQGRNLVVTTKDEAKKRNIPIRTGNDPLEIPETAEMVMQIIPLRRLDAVQAATDLGPLMPSSATLSASQDSNSLIVTDTQINVRHIVTLVSSLDSSIDGVSTMRVFRLENADPAEMANLLTNVFQTSTTVAGASRSSAASKTGKTTARKQGSSRSSASAGLNTPVVAIADPRTYSVIVTADKEDMPAIAEIISQLDSSASRKQKVFVYTLENADVRQVENVLRNLFQSSGARTTTTNQPDPLTTRASSNTQTSGPNIQLGTTRR